MDFSIHDISEKIGVSSHTLRYYEKEQIIPRVRRNTSGHRIYNMEDIDWINFVTCLKSTGMPISDIREFIRLCKLGDESIGDRKKLLISHREVVLARIKKLNDYLDKIAWKINYYEGLEGEVFK